MTTLNGFVPVPRSVLTAPWYVEADTIARGLWLHLLLTVNFAPTVTRTGLALKPGQTVTSWGELANALRSVRTGHSKPVGTREVRRAAALLRRAGEATWQATGRPTYTGIVVTLERWALYGNETAQPTDHATDEATGGLSGARQHRNNTTGPVGRTENGNTESNGNNPSEDLAFRRRRERFIEQCAETEREIKRVRALERGEVAT
jgi:hypothetical protein